MLQLQELPAMVAEEDQYMPWVDFEESHEAERPRLPNRIHQPSARERDEHESTGCTLYRDWCLCCVGANGAGKTTLLKMIAGDEPSSGGQVNISEGEMAYLHQEADVEHKTILPYLR